MPDSGIYRIDFPNGKFYYGQSQSVRARKAQHMSDLRFGRHGNIVMQRCWDKYGTATFTKVLSVPAESLNEVEQSYLNVFVGMENCINIAKDARVPNRGLPHSTETRNKISRSMTGVPKSQQHRNNTSAGKRAIARIYPWTHAEHGDVDAPVWEMVERWPGLLRTGLANVLSGRAKSHKGWRKRVG